jgi:iron(III) transport system ATP-binding protein
MPAQDVHLEAVSCHFGSVAAVDHIDLHIPAGRMVTLLGPSGCGKTTTLRLLAGLEQPSTGRIRVGGRDITELPTHERDIGMVFQSYALFPHLSVADNVGFGLVALKLPRAEQTARVAEALELVDLAALAARRPAELSGGQQQRVALARALVLRPALLLLDEPLSNLDAGLRLQMRHEIRALQQRLGLTAVYVTHDQEEALAVSDQIVLMRAGRIAQCGSPRELVERPANAFVASFIGQALLLDAQSERLADGRLRVVSGALSGALSVDLPADAAGADLPTGACTLAVRPWALQPIALAEGAPPSSAQARVLAVHYLGQRSDVELALNDGRRLSAALHEPADAVPAPGQAVRLQLHARGCAVLPPA